jgi:hypothetical protein
MRDNGGENLTSPLSDKFPSTPNDWHQPHRVGLPNTFFSTALGN